MPKSSVHVTVDTSRLNRILRNLGGNVEQAVSEVADDIVNMAKDKAPVLTGALRASIHKRTNKTNPYSQVASEVKSRRPEAQTTPLPVPEHKGVAYVGPVVHYAAVVEMGSTRRPAKPYLTPAVREVTNRLERAHKKAFKRICTDKD
jgi:HK97 gp10 family phage protein